MQHNFYFSIHFFIFYIKKSLEVKNTMKYLAIAEHFVNNPICGDNMKILRFIVSIDFYMLFFIC